MGLSLIVKDLLYIHCGLRIKKMTSQVCSVQKRDNEYRDGHKSSELKYDLQILSLPAYLTLTGLAMELVFH
jgi:hypothetical protein